MTWTYFHDTGRFYDDGRHLLATGYSGFGAAKNDPHQQCLPNAGPIPRGIYAIGNAFDDELKGPVVLPLLPSPANDMCDRSGFFIHGDSRPHPGSASNGCIVLNSEVRVAISESEDRQLRVVSSLQMPADALIQELVWRVKKRRNRKIKGGKKQATKSKRKSSKKPDVHGKAKRRQKRNENKGK